MKMPLFNHNYFILANKLLLVVALLNYAPASLADSVEERLAKLEQQVQLLNDELKGLQTKLEYQNDEPNPEADNANNPDHGDTGVPVASQGTAFITYEEDSVPVTSSSITPIADGQEGAPVTSPSIVTVTSEPDNTPIVSAPDADPGSEPLIPEPAATENSAIVTTDTTEEPSAPAVLVDESVAKENYQTALNQLKAGLYTDAIKAFRTFIKAYPDSRYAGNAQYWLGEAYYVSRNFPAASLAFNQLLEHYPANNKIAGGMLKLGYISQENGETTKASEILEQLIQKFPNSTEAKLAQKRLNTLNKAK